ncbi:MAG: ATP phosphoribosyltransferase [Endomicrobium sp.]|uniref:ATP phosphoribosyltransferase n=1 Tax=Candidatus Endomicrobiellum pyrsonymphae TaxID=1408203 RepID=UPI0035857D84|nr:ATP phosphoribosyltransferase [Endomicrobium sp.]
MRKIIIALPKGRRLLSRAYSIFKKAKYTSQSLEKEIELRERKQLEFECDNGEATFLLIRVADVPQYVDKNWADIGISTFDGYREYELENTTSQRSMRGDNFVTNIFADLKLCEKSRFCVAGEPKRLEFYEQCKQNDDKILTIATQHPNIAAKYFLQKNMVVDIITITGSSEIMPKYGEVDAIFDIVESGRALEENGLIIFEEAMLIKTKILVSKAALKYDENISKMIGRLENVIK